MRIKTGCDMVCISRFAKLMAQTPEMKERLFLPLEIVEKEGSLAGKFAAKEAVMKALGIPAGKWHEIEVRKRDDGRPELALHGEVNIEILSQDISISHDGDYAFAVAVFLIE